MRLRGCASTSSRVGRLPCAPALVTARAPAATAPSQGDFQGKPPARAAATLPLKASPAPTVSTVATRDGAASEGSRGRRGDVAEGAEGHDDGAGPRPAERLGGREGGVGRRRSASPDNASASMRFGVRIATWRRRPSRRIARSAGAGLRIVVIPAAEARRRAWATVAAGDSSPASRIDPRVEDRAGEAVDSGRGQPGIGAGGDPDHVLAAVGRRRSGRRRSACPGDAKTWDTSTRSRRQWSRDSRPWSSSPTAARQDDGRPGAGARRPPDWPPSRRGPCEGRPPRRSRRGRGGVAGGRVKSTLIEPRTTTRGMCGRDLRLFADAEASEDAVEDLVVDLRADDLPQLVDRLPHVDRRPARRRRGPRESAARPERLGRAEEPFAAAGARRRRSRRRRQGRDRNAPAIALRSASSPSPLSALVTRTPATGGGPRSAFVQSRRRPGAFGGARQAVRRVGGHGNRGSRSARSACPARRACARRPIGVVAASKPAVSTSSTPIPSQTIAADR